MIPHAAAAAPAAAAAARVWSSCAQCDIIPQLTPPDAQWKISSWLIHPLRCRCNHHLREELVFTPFWLVHMASSLSWCVLGVPLSVYLTISIVFRLHYEYQHHLSQGGTLSLALYTVKHCSFHTHDILVSSFKLFTKLERGGRFIIHNTHGPVSMGTAILQNGKIWSLICQWGITT